jgi:hypothetical protein
MAEIEEKNSSDTHKDLPQDLDWSQKNTIILVAGILLLAIGYVMLAFVDREASNIAGRISPILILSGYVVVISSVLAGGNSKD